VKGLCFTFAPLSNKLHISKLIYYTISYVQRLYGLKSNAQDQDSKPYFKIRGVWQDLTWLGLFSCSKAGFKSYYKPPI